MVEATAVFDLYWLLVENVFGSVLLSGLGLVILFGVMGMVCRMSPTTLMVLMGFFIGVFSIGMWGELAVVPLFVLSFMWFAIGVGRFLMRRLEAY